MQERVIPHYNVIKDFINKYPDFKDKDELLAFSKARMEHNIKDLYKYRSLAPQTVKFEIALAFVPSFLFNTLIRLVRKIS